MVRIISTGRTSIGERLNAEQSSSNFSSDSDFIRGTGGNDFFGFTQEEVDLVPVSLGLGLPAQFGLPNNATSAEFVFGFIQEDPVDLVPLVNALNIPGEFGLDNTPENANLVLDVFIGTGDFPNLQKSPPQKDLPAALVDLQAATIAFGGPDYGDTNGLQFGTLEEAYQFIFDFRASFGWDTSSSKTTQAGLVGSLVDLSDGMEKFGIDLPWDTASEALAVVANNTAFFGIDADFGGDDRILGRGGDDVVVDLEGDNLVFVEDGDDQVFLGNGNDRVVDKGGNNVIIDLGGNNTINLLGTTSFLTPNPGEDRVTVGDGNDNINAFDGRNFIDAGDGDNIVRGGENYDEIRVGDGDDFVDVRGAFVDEDANGNGVIDLGEDGNFNGVLDPADTETFAVLNGLGIGFEAHNSIFDGGGSDNLRASGNDEGDDLVLSDVVVDEDVDSFPGFRALTLGPADNLGDDRIELGAGDNLVIDAGGNDTVRTLFGEDRIITSFFSAGDDEISSGAGNDTIDPGSGADTVTGGAGGDIINLSDTNNSSAADGSVDTIVYTGLEDLSVSTFDLVEFFEGFGVDVIDVSALDRDGDGVGDITGFGPGGLSFLNSGTTPGFEDTGFDGESDGNDLLIGWDFGGLPEFELGVDPIIAVLEEFDIIDDGLTPDNFTLA